MRSQESDGIPDSPTATARHHETREAQQHSQLLAPRRDRRGQAARLPITGSEQRTLIPCVDFSVDVRRLRLGVTVDAPLIRKSAAMRA